MREATVSRQTKETDIAITLNLDGGDYHVATGVGFLDHMLELFAHHGGFGLELKCEGDVRIDFHHSTEDVAIALGNAFIKALGDPAGIGRYGSFAMPMDEALVLVAVDLSGRAALGYRLQIPTTKVGDFDTELVEEFMVGFARSLGASVHIHQLAGDNSHHIIEAAFKGLGRAMAQAVALTGRGVPSTKGMLDWGQDQ